MRRLLCALVVTKHVKLMVVLLDGCIQAKPSEDYAMYIFYLHVLFLFILLAVYLSSLSS